MHFEYMQQTYKADDIFMKKSIDRIKVNPSNASYRLTQTTV